MPPKKVPLPRLYEVVEPEAVGVIPLRLVQLYGSGLAQSRALATRTPEDHIWCIQCQNVYRRKSRKHHRDQHAHEFNVLGEGYDRIFADCDAKFGTSTQIYTTNFKI